MVSFKDNLPKYIEVDDVTYVLTENTLSRVMKHKRLYYVGYKKLLPNKKTSFYLITAMFPNLETCYTELFFNLNLKYNYIDVSKDYE